LALSVATVLPVLAQEVYSPEPPAQSAAQAPAPAQQAPPAPPAAPVAAGARSSWHRFDEPDATARPAVSGQARAMQALPEPALPVQITLPAGTWINMRLDQPLSSDRNHAGDSWTATLTQPVIVNGRVVAQRGERISGTVSEAAKANKATKGFSHLGLEPNEMALADGRQIPLKARLIQFGGAINWGRDSHGPVTTISTGAAAGAAPSSSVLLTRGRPTVLYPEEVLTFRMEAPVSFVIDNEGSLRAFAPVQPNDYQTQHATQPQTLVRAPGAASYYAPYGYYPPYYYSPYWYGPSIGVYLGGGWGWGGGWGRGWGRGGRW